MGGAFGNLGIGASALQAEERLMAAVGANVANTSTPGYRRQDVTLSEQEGGGVATTQIQRASDPPLEQAVLAGIGAQGEAAARADVLSETQNIFPGPSGAGFGTALNDFWSAWQSVANNPTSVPARQQVLSTASVLAARFQSAALQLTQLQEQVGAQQSAGITQVNGLLAQIASLNKRIGGTTAGLGRNTLENEQSGLVEQAAALVGIQSQRQSNGTLVLYNGGTEIVSASGQPANLTVVAGTPRWSGGSPAAGGSIGGQQVAEGSLGGYFSNLNALANTVMSHVNNAQARGYDLNGNVGQNLFTGSSAATMAVSSTMTVDGLAASTSGAAGDGANAQAVADLGGIGTGSIAQQLAGYVSATGSDVQQAQEDQTASSQQLAGIRTLGQSAWGASLNTQAVAMTEAQRSYQAAAIYVQTQGQMLNSLIQAMANA